MNYTRGKWEAEQQQNISSGKYEWVIKVKEDDVKSRVIATTPYSQKYNDHEANANLIVTAVNGCASVNPKNPQAVAESIKDMYEALKLFSLHLGNHSAHSCAKCADVLIQALSKAEGR